VALAIIEGNVMPPITGKIICAAFLKNDLREMISSLSFLSIKETDIHTKL
jgi:hypothetical protein